MLRWIHLSHLNDLDLNTGEGAVGQVNEEEGDGKRRPPLCRGEESSNLGYHVGAKTKTSGFSASRRNVHTVFWGSAPLLMLLGLKTTYPRTTQGHSI